MSITKKQYNQLAEVAKAKGEGYDFNDYLFNYIEFDDIKTLTSWEEIEDYINDNDIRDNMCDSEVIYYYNAIKYLSENDQSLQKSIEIAEEYGCQLSDINSELLASLLMTRNLQEDFSIFLSEVKAAAEDILN